MTDVASPALTRRRRRRRARLATTVAVLVLGGLGWGAYRLYNAIFVKHPVVSSCQVVGVSTGTVYKMAPDQLLNASIIADVAMQRALPERAVVIALATALQESKMRNIDYGDADSLGLFQQRPSQGWGSPAQVMTPTYAAGKFYDELLKVPNWQSIPLTQAADAVQRSAFPDAYRDWEPRATALAAALTGTTNGQLSCRLAHPGTTSPLSTATDALTGDLRIDLAVTSPALGGVDAKVSTVTVSGLGVTGAGGDSAARHRDATVAAWALAHAEPHGITSVTIGDREWRADRDGWHDAKNPAPVGSVVMTVTSTAKS
jgi:hypothetical protein